MEKRRCSWCISHPLMTEYHDTEWGVPVHDDRKHYEFLVLDAAQAGLSWLTVLKKRNAYRKAFAGFDYRKVAEFDSREIKRLLENDGIIRNRMKIEAAVNNAKKFIEVRQEYGTFDKYIWKFVGGKTIHNNFRSVKEMPALTAESIAMSKDLKRRGFTFAGKTICYAYMQAAGLVNDHTVDCFRHKEIKRNKT